MTALDLRPLTDPADQAAVRAYAEANPTRSENTVTKIVLVALATVMVILFLAMSPASALISSAFSAIFSGGFMTLGLPLQTFLVVAFLVVAAAAVIGIVLGLRAIRSLWRKRIGPLSRYRLHRFARSNNMTFQAEVAEPRRPGLIFGIGRDRAATLVVCSPRPRFTEIANYRFVTGRGLRTTTHHWGYVAVKLDVRLPHIVLDARSGNSLFGSNLPIAYTRTQRLSLEGDFDRHFSLYCPKGYEADALYLFTPDVMARCIDHVSALDVEIVDDWLFLYAKRDLSTLDPDTWAWLFSAVDALRDRFAQWERWRDERVAGEGATPPPALPHQPRVEDESQLGDDERVPRAEQARRPPQRVATPGRRLRTIRLPVSITAIVVIGYLVANLVLSLLTR